MSAEQFLKLFDRPFQALTGVPIPLSPLIGIAQPIYARLGVKTGQERVATVDRPIHEALAALLCSLARNGQVLHEFHLASDGCMVEAVLPSDLWSWEGKVLVALRRTDPRTEVRASTAIKGQMFDWGKSSRCLDALLLDIGRIPVMI
ncbi:hypothetical protein [Longimicrobium sp.]|uniref:hypothetical protein n=1 Tax=Longimicrobium sp. TaxID=2029185 RepID=UPI002BD5A4B9|nr:hypothetical protein [Longimicrobium sp.]HSU13768.1 hypothetical protein [Longimicrobium sp.]